MGQLRRESRGMRLLRWWQDAFLSLPLFTLVLLAAIWGVTLHFIDAERAAARAAAVESVQELIATYEAQVARNLNGIDQTLKLLKYVTEKKGPEQALKELSQQGLLPSGLVFVVSLTDARGNTLASSPAARNIPVSGQDYFKVHKARNSDSVYVAQTMRDQSNQDWHLHFSRRLNDAGGNFAGIAIVEVDPAYFTSGYERSRQGELGVQGLLGQDGVLRVLRVGEKVSWGQNLARAPLSQGQPQATPWDGIRRYMAARPLHGFALTAVAGLAESEVMAGVEQRRLNHLWEAGVASAVLLLAMAMTWLWCWQGARARRRIRLAQETYAAASEANMDSFFVLRALRNEQGAITDFRITTANSRAEKMTGLSKQELQGQTLCAWLPETRNNGIFDKLVRITNLGGTHHEEMENIMPQVDARWLHWQVVGVEGGVVAIVRDISERKAAEERIYHMAHHDTLTGLPNRSLIGERLRQAIERARRDKQAVAVAFIDLDSFKLVNDGLGHNAGDELLKQVAERMALCLRREDTVGRFGGDEFVLVLPQACGEVASIAPLLERIRAEVIRPVLLEGQEVQVSCSIGVSMYPRDGADPGTLLMNADAAMYRAKDGGKNNYQFYACEMNASLEEKLALMDGLRKAVDERQLRLEYQPKLDLESGRIFGVEALLRWQHPERGAIRPDQFIPLAEESGAIVAIGEWVLREACRQGRAWQDAGLPPLTISVNVSPRQFDDLRLEARVAEALQQSGLAPRWLELEVTESLIMRDVQQAVAKMRELEAMGLALSIDDFGTGYSSLAALKSFPIGRLKIDKSFVRDLGNSADDQAIARAIISLAHQLQLRVIAEGVETAQQCEFLRANGCDELQGYLLSPPLAADGIAALLQAGTATASIPQATKAPAAAPAPLGA
ncbi:EAL domain-containing protein [Massilia sp. NR 4-1]|uniref:bifunctional diguanylate cyclase/phosphodiesterase n=1 Tax=Massilia sp. NR 4-1 TaxID=1678028 RepID=UPI00067BCA23|nr:EAL domain-containing protein [Massilia sp. NR 4-1]